MKYIERTTYLDRLIQIKNTPDIKIITGIRRCGKSELLKAYMRYLYHTETDPNIIYIDFTNLDFDDYKNYKALNEYVESHFREGRMNYLFIDEVQLCPKFELAVNSLHSSGKYDIYITGSNAFLLSSDLATLFTGRFIEIPVYPFSFSEFHTYYDEEKDLDALFDSYVIKGGLAGSYAYKLEEDRISYLSDVYKTIVQRDLVNKYRVTDTNGLSHLADFMMDNISNLTSPNKVSNILNENGITSNHVMVNKYIGLLCNAFLFYDIKRYDIKGKKYLETIEKYYLCDLGFRYALLGTRNMDYGRAYENIVCLELLRRGFTVYVGKLYQKEIDFIATKQSEKKYIQVSDNISSPKTLEREIAPLKAISDDYPKILIARTKHDAYDLDGIKIIDIARWLADPV